MRKLDLRAGYTLVDERGRNWYLFESEKGLSGYMFKDDKVIEHNRLAVDEALNDDLTIAKKSLNPSCDIVEVRGLHRYVHNIFKDIINDTPLLWKRELKPENRSLGYVEKMILKTLLKNDYIYIARDLEFNGLYAYNNEISKNENWEVWTAATGVKISSKFEFELDNTLFDFIKWEDDKPYDIEDLLKEN